VAIPFTAAQAIKPLIEELDLRFPDRCARPGMSPEAIWREAGARQVIEFLKALDQELSEKRYG
jgi:hypothetical protein